MPLGQSDSRWTVRVRRCRPGDNDWPYRWRTTILDEQHYDRFDGRKRAANVHFTEAAGRRWAARYIRKVERSEASEREVAVDG